MQTQESTKNRAADDAAFIARARRTALTNRIALVGTFTRWAEPSALKEDHPVPTTLDYGNRHAQGAQKHYRTGLWLKRDR